MGDFCITGFGVVCLAGCAARRGLSGLRVGASGVGGRPPKSRVNKTYTKNIDLRHIFALYRKLATVKEVLL
ncbi:hypothetical protein CRG95_09375 [Escherichia sp. E4208]|nr:hypothetical protein D9740_18450 [Escherichia sp. E14V5]RZN04673.1 hypothetical protein D9741_07120 [Escherichia sp. E14V7]RZN27292.1 hypothetical protein D9739_09075 [Escherichia sp. E14V10]TGB55781.1 hypothetical protein CRT22_15670 [Escherichia sp. E5028]TGB70627.1 hypothetical protein CRI67_25485 [Escherichia sp. E4702]TGB85367.1 hypothetical protein CRG95_09375 [Escherichia sp. E4208]TLI93293.1 hypothetical protein FEK41_18040 [Escherichia sp. E4694]